MDGRRRVAKTRRGNLGGCGVRRAGAVREEAEDATGRCGGRRRSARPRLAPSALGIHLLATAVLCATRGPVAGGARRAHPALRLAGGASLGATTNSSLSAPRRSRSLTPPRAAPACARTCTHVGGVQVATARPRGHHAARQHRGLARSLAGPGAISCKGPHAPAPRTEKGHDAVAGAVQPLLLTFTSAARVPGCDALGNRERARAR